MMEHVLAIFRKLSIRRLRPLMFLSFVIFSSCGDMQTENMSDKNEIVTGKSLPIDGVYEMSSGLERGLKKVFGVVDIRQKVKLDKGLAYYTSTSFWDEGLPDGKVFLKEIRKINDTKYKGVFYPLHSPVLHDTSFVVSILVEGNDLKINTPPRGPLKVSQTINFELLQ